METPCRKSLQEGETQWNTRHYRWCKEKKNTADKLSSFHTLLQKSLTWYKKIAVDIWTQEYKLTVLQVQEQLIRHFLEPAASTMGLHYPARLSMPSSYSFPVSSTSPQKQLEELLWRQNKLVRRRCTGCYVKLKAQCAHAIRAKQVHTQCKQCEKAFCLDCFNENHVWLIVNLTEKYFLYKNFVSTKWSNSHISVYWIRIRDCITGAYLKSDFWNRISWHRGISEFSYQVINAFLK